MKRLLFPFSLLLIIFISISCEEDNRLTQPYPVPDAPTLWMPVNNSMDVSVPPTLVWHASPRAKDYTLQVSVNSLFTSFIFNESGLTDRSQQILGLNHSSTYYWRVNASNSAGTSGWSTPWSFTTMISECGNIVEYAGKLYNSLQIGNQCWLKENLDVGTMIQGGDIAKDNDTIEKYCYNNISANCNTYGGLYQWDEAMQYKTTPGTRGICPSGWHIPTYAEYDTLRITVGGNGNSLKAIGQGAGEGEGTDSSGFSALLGGFRHYDGYFSNLGSQARFWISNEFSPTLALNMSLYYDYISIGLYDYNGHAKESGFSIRCLKD
jgi:uncharacterized protein (TIGR02145 family)